MFLTYAIRPEAVPLRLRHSQVLPRNGRVNIPRLEAEVRAHSGVSIALAEVTVVDNELSLSFRADLLPSEVALVDEIVRLHSGDPLPTAPSPATADRRPLVAISKPDWSKKTIISHDWTDPTTWYTAALRVADEVATNSGDNTTYNLANQNVIDLGHGKVFNEDFIRDAEGRSYRVEVKVNGATKVERDPHTESGDFTVDYAGGKIAFASPLDPLDSVVVTYYRATSSLFVIRPDEGKALRIVAVETQFALDVELRDSVVFQPMGFVDVFAPQLVQAGVVPSGTKIPLGDPVVYKSFTDFQAEAVRSYPSFPVIGGSNWRATPREILVMNWDYVSETALRADYGLEVRIQLQHDQPFAGWYASATFYCTSEAL